MNKKCVIVSGGSIDDLFAMQMIENIKPDCVIGVDSGLNFLYDCYESEHTLSIEDAVEDMYQICRRNGGELV